MKKKSLPTDVQTLQELLINQTKLVSQLQSMIEGLQQQIETLLRQLYGKKSEKKSKPPEDPDPPDTPSSGEGKSRSTQKKTSSGRHALPEHLKKIRIEHDLPCNEKTCRECDGPLHKMGEVITEQLEFQPAQLIVQQHVRFKYGCRPCGGEIKLAGLPAQPIDKGLPGPGLLAEVLINKYADALPLYRQEQRWDRLGYALPRSTSSRWFMECGSMLRLLVERMIPDGLLKSPKINTDDTHYDVQSPVKVHRGFIWVYRGTGEGVPACTVYQYTRSRTQEAPKSFLKNYQGYLQADAYPGYDKLYKDGKIVEVGCMAHARRKFYDITKLVKSESLADDALEFIGKLYAIERTSQNFSNDQRRAYRKRHAKPILKSYKRWLLHYEKITLSKSPIGKAIAYSLNHWNALTRYLARGFLDIDNNEAERAIKPLVIGRKNYLFAGSQQAAEMAAVMYSLIETCKQHTINVFDYFKDVLSRLPSQRISKLEELLPYNWNPLPE